MENEELIPGKVHPGEFLAQVLRDVNKTQRAFSSETGIHATIISQLISGKRAFSPLIALKVERVLGIDAFWWMKLQYMFQINELRKIDATRKLYLKRKRGNK